MAMFLNECLDMGAVSRWMTFERTVFIMKDLAKSNQPKNDNKNYHPVMISLQTTHLMPILMK